MTMMRFAVAAVTALGLVAVATPGSAQQYPTRTVTIVVPYPAGGPTDQTARVVAQSMGAQLKQSFIVENLSGGNTIVACEKVAHSTPDGYTLILPNLQISANVTLFKKLPFDTVKDFTPVMLINRNPLVLVGRKTLPANNLEELIALMKKQRLRAAIPGYGATGHLATALLAQQAGAKIDMIPYRGAAPAITDLLGGQVDLFFATPQSVVQMVNTGKLKAFGVTSKERLPELPNVESFVSVLGPKLDFVYWQALFAPGKTPAAVIKRLNAAAQKAVADPAIVKTWAAEGISVFPPEQRTPAAAEAFFKSEIARWGDVIRTNNIHLEQ
ncbi:MAG: Bug family tripartite tricarboxylate transporter substrate binding protein [Xanthobacteraceae bacterium]